MRILVAILAAASACLGSPSAGLRAYNRGDHPSAFRIWQEDAARGDRESQYHLALLYIDGEGVGKDLAEALKWLKLSAEAGWHSAQSELGWFLSQGIAGPKDPVRARLWLERSVDQGNLVAMNRLGLLYFNGRGVPVDNQRAFDLFRRAAVSVRAAMFNLGLVYETGRGQPKDLVEAVAWYSLAAEKGEPGAVEERDAILGMLSPEEKRLAKSRLAALHRKRLLADLKQNGAHYLFLVRNIFVFVWGVIVLTGYLGDRIGWKWRILTPEVQREFLDRTGSRLRRCFLWYKPWGVMGWCLHLWFFLVLAVSVISALALAALPVDEGWIAFAITLLVVLILSRGTAVHRDKHALGRLAERRAA